MIKALTTKKDGGKLLILGIDDRNIAKLTTGDPMIVRGAEIGLTIDILIVHKPTLADVTRYLQDELNMELPKVVHIGKGPFHFGDEPAKDPK